MRVMLRPHCVWGFVPAILAVACGGADFDAEREIAREEFAVTIPAKGAATTLDVGSWNLEWFGDTGNGPSNEALQLSNAKDVIIGADLDIWGFAEIVSQTQWNNLESQLPGYTGFMAKESVVVGGATYYSDFSGNEQNVAILYKSSLATLQDARIILGSNDTDFAGRPPLQVTLRVTLNGATEDIVVIVLHAKCCTDTTSWQRRQNASVALKSYLDSNFPTQKVWVIGDFNDDVDTSITPQHASPYANFVNDAADYKFPSKALSDAGISSTVGYSDTIDHHLNSNDSNASYIANSVEVYRVDQYIANYSSTTSDHFPVLTRYNWSGGGAPADVIINEIGANEPGSNTAGEFIEVRNAGGTAANIGSWTLSDGSSVRHTFAAGTTLNPGKAIVVFGASSGIPGGLTNAVAASTGGLSLSNSGDSVTLKNSSGVAVDGFSYSSSLASSDGVSINLSPDGDPSGSFVKHNTISSLSSSPGKRASGVDW
ncbi:MAG: lamin tail domain-containing protein [Myxococcota bacterium]